MVERERSRELAAMLTTLANINAGAPPDMREPCFIDEAADMLLALERDLAAARAENDKLREALECIAEEHDAGRHDGLPEPCPAHDADTMFAIACAALAEKEPAK